MINLEALTQIVNNINEAKEALELAKVDRADIAEELIAITLDEDREVSEELRHSLIHVEHEIDIAEETIEASKAMLIAIIEETDETVEEELL
jgi:hypothetical protein